jgi:hypothetical protein
MEEIIEWLTTNLTAEKFAVFGQFILSGGVLTWVATIYNKFKTQQVQTPKDIATSVESKIKGAIEEALKPMQTQIDKVVENEKVIAESIALLSSDDAASKLALIQNISKIDNVDVQIVEIAKEAAVEEAKKEAELQTKVEEALEELEKPVEYL